MSMQQNEPSYQDMWNYFQPPLPPPLPLPPKKNHAGLYLGILGAVMLLCSFSSFSSGNMSYSLFFLFVSGGILTLGIFLHKSLHKLPIPPQPYMPPSILTDEEYERWVASKQDV